MNTHVNDRPPATNAACAALASRRNFFKRLSVGLSSTAAALLALPVVAFVVAPLFRRAPAVWVAAGRAAQFRIGETVAVKFQDPSSLPWAGVTANAAAWLRREGETEFVAFAINCSHLGCPVRWLEDAELFMCPCHGGIYYKDGTVAAGPPPRPLARYAVRVQDGQVQLRTRPIPITT